MNARYLRIAMAVAVSLSVLAVLEGLARRLEGAPELDGIPLEADADLLWRLDPGEGLVHGVQTRVNRLGMRGGEVGPRTRGSHRFLTLGDSSVFGVLVRDDQVFSSVAQARLGPTVEAVNGAMPGYSTWQSRILCERHLDRVDPDLLVIGNLWSDGTFDGWIDSELIAQHHRLTTAVAIGVQRVLLRSALYREVASISRREAFHRVGFGTLRQDASRGQRRVPVEEYAANLEVLAGLGLARGGVVFLLLANREDLKEERPRPWDVYRAVLRDTAARAGCPVLDVPELFRASGAPADELFLDDLHPSAEGHRRIGEALARLLEERGWREGRAICAGGPGGGPVAWIDPWVRPLSGSWPPDARDPYAGRSAGPDLAGIVRTSEDNPVEIVLSPEDGGPSIDHAVVPGGSWFALRARGAARVRIEVRTGRPGAPAAVVPLNDPVIDLRQGPAWGLVIDLDRGVIEGKG